MDWHTTQDDKYKRVLRNDVSRIEYQKYPASASSTVVAIYDFADGHKHIAFNDEKRDAEDVIDEVKHQIEQLSLKSACPMCGQDLSDTRPKLRT